jgi:glycosyltransferase involved in cell wall biosynthesis
MPNQKPKTTSHKPRTIALLIWSDLIEDYLGSIGLILDDYCTQMTGGWLFNYVEALKTRDIATVLMVVSAKAGKTYTTTHLPTGIPIVVLPAAKSYLFIRRFVPDPYTPTKGKFRTYAWHKRWVLEAINDALPYLCTPLLRLRKALRLHQCSAILCQEYEYGRFDACVWLGRMMKLPVFASFQGGDYQVSRLESWIRPRTIRKAAGLIIAPAAEIARVQRKYGVQANAIKRIFNPLDLRSNQAIDKIKARQELALPLHATIIVFHGRINIKQKGLDNLMAAWQMICQRLPQQELLLLLVGGGDDAPRLQQIIQEQNITRLHWVNQFINDRKLLSLYLSAADIAVLSSRQEGFPVAPTEAMAHGLPLVASAANGVADILEEGEQSGGILVPVDDVPRLAAALEELIVDEERRLRMGEAAKRQIENRFGLEAVGKELEAFLFPDA